ncbi:MAG: hypothetical protein HY975_01870 [Candidatus Kerfeldbacteria bacterium]|nr:hypothetical protein [Candidatus Kerfeldbacteria bacterium]
MPPTIRLTLNIAAWALALGFGLVHGLYQHQIGRRLKEKYPEQFQLIRKRGWRIGLFAGLLHSFDDGHVIKQTLASQPPDDIMKDLQRSARWTGGLAAFFFIVAGWLTDGQRF